MSDKTAPPAWLPSSVARAARHGSAHADDLDTGAAWAELIDALRRADAFVRSDRSPGTEAERIGGYRHLLVLLALGIDEALRIGDPYEPKLRPGSTDAVLKWGMDCPDALYLGAPVRADAVYRLTGRRGSARYVGLQTMAGMASTANVLADDLETGADGEFAMILSADERAGNWMPLGPDVGSLVVRQFFYDWETEEPATLAIEVVSGPPPRGGGPLTTPATASQIRALGAFVEESLRFWATIQSSLRDRGVNAFHEPGARTDLGGAEENVTVWGAWEIEEDEALLVEVTPPEAIYWSIALGNHWWESIDYANHQSSLNGHQAVLDDDGVFRAVIARTDPGVANWLDTAGNRGGPMIMRYVRGADAPVPATRLVPLMELDDALPPGSVHVDPAQRARTIAARRAAVARRFHR